MDLKTKIIILVSVLGIGYAFGRYLQPEKVVTKIQIKKEIVTIEVEKEKILYRTIVRYITKKDGTVIKEEIKEELKETENISRNENNTDISKSKTITYKKAQYKVQLLTQVVGSSTAGYKLGIEKRFLGPIFLGVWSETNFHTYGLSVSWEF